jgi:hypothetical protein
VSRVEAARWRERLQYEAGLIKPRPTGWGVPPDCSPQAQQIAHGVDLLLGLRDAERWTDQPFTFARGFAAAWCGMSKPDARKGIEELRDRRYLQAVGSVPCGAHDAILWQLGWE